MVKDQGSERWRGGARAKDCRPPPETWKGKKQVPRPQPRPGRRAAGVHAFWKPPGSRSVAVLQTLIQGVCELSTL